MLSKKYVHVHLSRAIHTIHPHTIFLFGLHAPTLTSFLLSLYVASFASPKRARLTP